MTAIGDIKSARAKAEQEIRDVTNKHIIALEGLGVQISNVSVYLLDASTVAHKSSAVASVEISIEI